MYSDIKTFLRYINLRNSKCKDITKERLREAEIINIEIYDLQRVNSFIINDFLKKST